jgi:hypothetical protein
MNLTGGSHASRNYFLNTGKTACGIIGGKLFFLQAGPVPKENPHGTSKAPDTHQP